MKQKCTFNFKDVNTVNTHFQKRELLVTKMQKLISSLLCLPLSNSEIERMFSQFNQCC